MVIYYGELMDFFRYSEGGFFKAHLIFPSASISNHITIIDNITLTFLIVVLSVHAPNYEVR